MICKFYVKPVLLNRLNPFAYRLFVFHFMELGVGVPFELRPASFVEEECTPFPHHFRDGRTVEDAIKRREQAVDHVWVVVHAQLEVFDDVVDGEVVCPAASPFRILPKNMMLLVLVEFGWFSAEIMDVSGRVRKDKPFGRDAEAVDVHVGCVVRHAVRDRPHDCLVLHVRGEKVGR